jgi:hypothetical protein
LEIVNPKNAMPRNDLQKPRVMWLFMLLFIVGCIGDGKDMQQAKLVASRMLESPSAIAVDQVFSAEFFDVAAKDAIRSELIEKCVSAPASPRLKRSVTLKRRGNPFRTESVHLTYQLGSPCDSLDVVMSFKARDSPILYRFDMRPAR